MLKLFSVVALALLAPVLCADSIGYYSAKEVKWDNNVEITAWSWSKVDYTDAGKAKTVARKDVVAITRSSDPGSMSSELSSAIGNLANDPQGAIEQLDAESKAGTPLNKEEAKFRLAAFFAANANSKNAKLAADKLREYISAYKDGYFLGEAYTLLGRMNILGRDNEGARATYKEMARLGSPYDAKAHQARGELELLVAGKAEEALAAFRDASKAAGADKPLKAKADAYAAWALVALKKFDDAKALAEPITKDDSLEDGNSTDDEAALAIAYRVVGDCFIDGSQAFEKGYDAHMLAAYYAWWVGGTTEGYSLGQAYFAAMKLASTDEKFKTRAEKLRSALESGYPAEFKKVSDKLKGG